MRVLLLKSLFAAVIAATLAGCAQPGNRSTDVDSTVPLARKDMPTDLAPGEQVDYAGHRCGNPNLHVKTHPCLFPRR